MAKTKVTDDVIPVTQEVYEEMIAELEERKNVKRPEIANRLRDARNLGDLSENYDYQQTMEENQLNETAISALEERLKKVKVVQSNKSNSVVEIGETIEIKNLDTDETRVVSLVGSEETLAANSLEGKISIGSPIGKAVHNARIGDEVEVNIGSRIVKYKILRYVK